MSPGPRRRAPGAEGVSAHSGDAPSRIVIKAADAAPLRGDFPSAHGKRLPPITTDAV
jgi:hypothetical protein